MTIENAASRKDNAVSSAATRVFEEERLDGALRVHLADGQPASDSLTEPDVLDGGSLEREKRNDCEPAKRLRLAELERQGPGWCVL